jgi:predicted PurR-regulated permease PerM
MNDSTADAGHITSATPGDRAFQIGTGWRDLAKAGMALMGVAIGVYLVWQTSSSLFIIFAGILFASFLDACTRALKPVVPVGRSLRLTLVILIFCGLIGMGLVWGTGKLPEQTRILIRVMDAQIDVLQQRLEAFGVDLFGPDGGRDFSKWFPDRGALFSHAHSALGTASGVLGSALVILFLGILFAFDPGLYRDGIVLLAKPSYRPRMRAVLDEMGTVLRNWLAGQVIRTIIMAACVWATLQYLGLPGAFVLGLQAGLSNFVPYLGPILAGIPIGLVAMPLGLSALLWAVGLYTIVQSVEGYIIGPLILRRAVSLPPAWTLVALVLLGALFGILGVALALPLYAVGRIAVLRFYVEDCLGDRLNPTT